MGKIFDMINRQVIAPKVNAAYQEGFSKAKEDIESFYSQGSPRFYTRTGLYGLSPDSYPPSGFSNSGSYHYSIWLDHPAYFTGTPGFPVLEEAQHNGSGILGKPNTWEEAVKDIEQALYNQFK